MQVYAQKTRRVAEPALRNAPEAAGAACVGNQSMETLMTGAEAPTAETMGHKVDLPDAIRAKMESSFGADLSGVEVYESRAVADAGARAMTVGSRIGFAPGALDFASQGGQALLGHEVSHVVSQARGQVSGSGFLQDHSLESRADREGAMAAAGESVYSGPVAPLSASNVTAAAGPMQAKKRKSDTAAVNASNSNQAAYDTASYLGDNVRAATGAESEQDPRRQAYLKMAEQDFEDAAPEQRTAFRNYVDDQADINNYLRQGKASISKDKIPGVKNDVKQMDKLFSDRTGLTEETDAYRGVNNSFMQYLFSQGGFDASLYSKGDGELDYDKIRSNGILEQINQKGITYQDKAFVSTSTSRGFADYFPKMDAIKKSNNQMQKDIFAYNKSKGKQGMDAVATMEERQAMWDAAVHNAVQTEGTHMMNMHLSDDVRGVAVDKMGDTGQNEFLLNRGMNYKVTGIHEIVPGRYEMDVEVLTPKGKKRIKKQVDKKEAYAHG